MGAQSLNGASRHVWPVTAALLVLYLVQVWRFDFVCDDAYISFKYARNLAEGHGLRFNVSESPPIEGFSNFLWVLWLGASEWLGIGSSVASRVASVASGVVLVAWLVRVFARMGLGTVPMFLSGLFVVLFPPFAVWSTSGLAILPFALLVFGAFELLIGGDRPRPVAAGLLGLGAALLRTEGILWALGIFAVALLSWLPRSRRGLVRIAWPYVAIVLGGFGAFLLWRVSYFGEWVSNTAHAKGEMTGFTLQRGIAYAVSFLLEFPSAAVVLLTSLLVVGRGATLRGTLALVVVLAAFGFGIAVGGDFMPFYRFFVLAVPFLAVLLATLVDRLWTVGGVARGAGAVVAVACAALSLPPQWNVFLVPEHVREVFRFRWTFFLSQDELVPLGELGAWERSKTNCEKWLRLGRALNATTAPGESLVLGPIGAVGYETDLHILDLGGLIDGDVGARPTSEIRRSPGHDRVVPAAWFADAEPTYVFARLTRKRGNMQVVARRVFESYLDHPSEEPIRALYAPEIIDLADVEGFGPDDVLVVGRRKR